MGAGQEPMVFTGPRSTMELWLGVGLAGLGVAIAAVGWSSPTDRGYVVVLMALWVSGGVAAVVVHLRRVRTVAASADGLRLVRMDGRERTVAWATVRRVRGVDELGFPARDQHLELVTGDLIGLPRRLPRGSIDHWRAAVGAPPPAPEGDVRLWRIPYDRVPGWTVLIQLPLVVAVLSRPWPGLPEQWNRYSVVVLLVLVAAAAGTVAFASRREAREVRADRDGLVLPRFRGPRRIPWRDIVTVKGTDGRSMDEPRVELRDRATVRLPPTVPATVIREWQQDLAPPVADSPAGL